MAGDDTMTDNRNTHPLIPSVYDRLLGDELPTEAALESERAAHVRRLKVAMKRDLENLLNTRCRCGGFPADLPELETSLVNYGIPDFAGANVGSTEQKEAFLQVIQASIERYEPRLQQVTLVPIDDKDAPLRRVLQFRVEAVLVTENEAEAITFVSTMEPSSGSYHVERD